MTPFLRKMALTAHIVFSVGWLGAIVPYLALAIAGLTSRDISMARAAYLSMELIGWYVIVPLSLAALLSGLVQSLGTPWGLFRHWWIVAKLVLTAIATGVLLVHMQAVSRMSRIAAEATWSGADFQALRIQLVIHAAGGLVVLLMITALSVFKPWGMTYYGRSLASQGEVSRARAQADIVPTAVVTIGSSRWARIVGVHAIIFAVVFLILHLAGGGFGHHGH